VFPKTVWLAPGRPDASPRSDATPTPTPTSHRTPPHSHQISRQRLRSAARDPSHTSDQVQPPATHPTPRSHPSCTLASSPPRSFPCRRAIPHRAPILCCSLFQSRPFPRPNVSSLQHPSDYCNICSILLKHTCIVIATSR
jgi:hypothetical protein